MINECEWGNLGVFSTMVKMEENICMREKRVKSSKNGEPNEYRSILKQTKKRSKIN